jgi:hypothetical protein
MIRPFHDPPSRRFFCRASLPVGFVLIVAGLVAARSSRLESIRRPSTDTLFPLESSPNPLLLGSLRPGHAASGEISLRNPAREPITIERIETSCPCLSIAPALLEIGPGRSATLIVRFNPAEDPDFRGSLSIEVTGLGTDGAVVFRTHVRLTVAGERAISD